MFLQMEEENGKYIGIKPKNNLRPDDFKCCKCRIIRTSLNEQNVCGFCVRCEPKPMGRSFWQKIFG